MKENRKVISANVSKAISGEIDKLIPAEFRNFSHGVEVLLAEALKARGIDIHAKLKPDGC